MEPLLKASAHLVPLFTIWVTYKEIDHDEEYNQEKHEIIKTYERRLHSVMHRYREAARANRSAFRSNYQPDEVPKDQSVTYLSSLYLMGRQR